VEFCDWSAFADIALGGIYLQYFGRSARYKNQLISISHHLIEDRGFSPWKNTMNV